MSGFCLTVVGLVMAVTMFSRSYAYSHWQRGYFGLYGAVIRPSVANYRAQGEVKTPYFNDAALETALRYYVEANMDPYAETNILTLFSNYSFNKPMRVTITLDAKFAFGEIWSRTASFTIMESKYVN